MSTHQLSMSLQGTLAVGMVLMLHAPHRGVVAAQAADFGFRFSVTDCATERLDTFSGEFTKLLATYPVQTATVPVVLSDAQMAAIYRAVEEIRFFDYPERFTGVPAGVQETICTDPHFTYRLEVRNAGTVHSVVWEDHCKPTSAEADRLRGLLLMVRGFIYAHPAYQGLPPLTVACM